MSKRPPRKKDKKASVTAREREAVAAAIVRHFKERGFT